jgi:hypothetical protein
MKTNIKFETKKPNKSDSPSPWKIPGHSTYQDMILKPEYQSRKFNFPIGKTWFRVLPSIENSRGWMVGVHSLEHGDGRHTHIKTIKPGEKSVFDMAYSWFKENKPELLYNKANPEGFRLLTKPLSVCWILVQDEHDKLHAKLLLTSGYGGERGGIPGLGHQLLTCAESLDDEVDTASDPLDPETGVQFAVEKLKAAGAQYPSYRLSVGRQPAPINQYLERLSEEELAAIRPLEEVIRVMDESEEWELLAKVIGPDYRDEIRATI